ncbi:MAG: hypothetical protein KQH63_15510, partial [Desulfobulbaceae bacterium]|nr:hypothetical protein [Desulfobulbaceae bacterium]
MITSLLNRKNIKYELNETLAVHSIGEGVVNQHSDDKLQWGKGHKKIRSGQKKPSLPEAMRAK